MWVQDVRKGLIMATGLVSLIAGGAAVAAGTGSQGGDGQTGQDATGTTGTSEFRQPDARDRTGSDDLRGDMEERSPTLNGNEDQEQRNQTEGRDNGSEVIRSPQHTHD
ncbi:MAG: hypothetical protein VX935_09845 [Pseudomonadota bacterium]|nr:hypothetical protein [Pseudomonadota bacterium]